MMRYSSRRSPAVQLVLACALWGAATVLNKALLASISPVALLVLQLIPSVLVLWMLVLKTGKPRPVKSALLPILLLGLLNPGISYTLNLMGLARISASVATLLWAAEPVMILGLAAIVLRELVTPRLLIVMLIGAIGVALVTNVGTDFGSTGSDVSGILLLLSAVLCCAFYTVFSRKVSEATDPLVIVTLQQTAGLGWAIVLLLGNTVYGSPGELVTIPFGIIAAAALSGLLYYAAAYWLYITALRSVPAAVAGSYFNLIPVFGVGLAFIFLGETLTPVQWLGGATILLSVVELVRLTARRPASSVSMP
ncbi:drug/metabolite transporter (DMT)-like permease [Phyllobacterium trifolii]|uniref:Drug/metabolite transporter (DMT)-like permease n=1 Tax=Phyllobacterium trifolii TaxID=300193 RepID=A0A839UBG4_9HYPH|nr:DMT family transporter [Phyllobacterium trifolii]MBB3147274.1 drug/metabolite transporter (DMT)-like permease [Phyllobacterium trifolii]